MFIQEVEFKHSKKVQKKIETTNYKGEFSMIISNHPEDIKSAIRKKGETLESLSIEWGYDPCAIATCLSRPWTNIQELVASFLETTPQTLWPERYHPNGKPIFIHHFRSKNINSVNNFNSQESIIFD